MSQTNIMNCLNQLFQLEMSGMIRYLHYSFMIMGYNRIPIQKWFRDQAVEAMGHSTIIGEKITALGGHPTMVAAKVEETNLHSIDQILKESLEFEQQALGLYKQLVGLAVESEDIALEEMARGLYKEEVEHVEEVNKMLRHK